MVINPKAIRPTIKISYHNGEYCGSWAMFECCDPNCWGAVWCGFNPVTTPKKYFRHHRLEHLVWGLTEEMKHQGWLFRAGVGWVCEKCAGKTYAIIDGKQVQISWEG